VDTSALALTAEHQQVVEDAQLFGEKWAPKATEIDRLDAAPTDAMIKDTAGDILFATTCTGRSVLKNTSQRNCSASGSSSERIQRRRALTVLASADHWVSRVGF
jgi:phosphosulfolactate phosphohydrolase-like enzyme